MPGTQPVPASAPEAARTLLDRAGSATTISVISCDCGPAKASFINELLAAIAAMGRTALPVLLPAAPYAAFDPKMSDRDILAQRSALAAYELAHLTVLQPVRAALVRSGACITVVHAPSCGNNPLATLLPRDAAGLHQRVNVIASDLAVQLGHLAQHMGHSQTVVVATLPTRGDVASSYASFAAPYVQLAA